MESPRKRDAASVRLRKIAKVRARQILDSRGNPTIEAEVWTRHGMVGRSAVPSGASKGTHEVLELRDGNAKRFGGMGVNKAVANVNELIAPKLLGMDSASQAEIDSVMIELDGTEDKHRLGANSILAVSMATARVAALEEGKSLFRHLISTRSHALPVPMMNVINGGKHAGNKLAVQEFLIEPVGTKSFGEALRSGAEIYHTLKQILKKEFGPSSMNVGDEGGYAPSINRTRDALDMISKAISESGYTQKRVRLGIDPASSEFYDPRSSLYHVDGKKYSAGELEDYYLDLVKSYPISTIEDPFYEEAFDDFGRLTKKLKGKVMVIGDDLYATNKTRIREGISKRATTAVLIKLNQIGSVSETLEAVKLSQGAGLSTVISHRSGETEDVFIAHLATAVGSEFIKTGAPARGERVAKYNELLRIEEELGDNAPFGANLGHAR
jgi:enolase